MKSFALLYSLREPILSSDFFTYTATAALYILCLINGTLLPSLLQKARRDSLDTSPSNGKMVLEHCVGLRKERVNEYSGENTRRPECDPQIYSREISGCLKKWLKANA